MDKKNFTSWGVSFASLALVAGMMSYLGIPNNHTTSKSNMAAVPSPTGNQSSAQATQSGNNESSSQASQATDNSGSQQTMNTSPPEGQFNQQGNFDTTTGGT